MHPKYWKRKALNHVLREEAGEGSAGGGALDAHSAAAAFGAFLSDEPQQAQEATNAQAAESPEAAAERIAAEEAKGAETEANAEESAAPQKFTIKVDGKDVQLTADEVAEHYKNGLRQADYTKKTTEAAEQRKAAEAQANEARAKRDEYASKLQGFTSQAEYEFRALSAQLTNELLDTDPVEYLRIERTARERQAQIQQAQQELGQINEQRQSEKAEAERLHIQNQREQLLAKVPEWQDEAKAKAEVAQLKDYLAQQGYESMGEEFTDHRAVILARKAMQYDALIARAKEAAKKVAAAPAKVERPGNAEAAKPLDGRTSAMKKLAATGSVSDAASIFAQMI